jgi:hypothetical protein
MAVGRSRQKEVRGWRWFLAEFAVVMAGVLAALGTQQAANWFDRQGDMSEARVAIRRELALNMAYLRSRSATNACLERRLDEVQAVIDSARPDGDFMRPSWVGRPQFWSLETVRWDAAAQSGRAALLPAQEMAHYSSMYTQLRIAVAEMGLEQSDWARLRGLQSLRRLPSQGAYDISGVLADARYRAWRIRLITEQELAEAKALGLDVITNRDSSSRSVCVPMTATPEQGRAQSGFPFGEL